MTQHTKSGRSHQEISITKIGAPTKLASVLPRSLYRGEAQFGEIAAECHVLEGERRVLTTRGITRLFCGAENASLRRFVGRIPGGDALLAAEPEIAFQTDDGKSAHGYDTGFVVRVCRLYIDALVGGKIHSRQVPIAARASVILSAVAELGIDALVDEATGYQAVRGARALQDKLAAVLIREAGKWRQLFTREFFGELAKLYRLELTSPNRRPGCFAGFIREFFYEWFDGDVYAELKARNPHPTKGTKHHQFLTDFGRERFERHQRDVLILMRACPNVDDFRMRFNAAFHGAGLQTAWGWR